MGEVTVRDIGNLSLYENTLYLLKAGDYRSGPRVDIDRRRTRVRRMSLAELKSELERLPAAEKSYLAAYLKHSARRQEAGYGEALDATWQCMETGEKVSLDRALQLSRELGKSGA